MPQTKGLTVYPKLAPPIEFTEVWDVVVNGVTLEFDHRLPNGVGHATFMLDGLAGWSQDK